MPIVQMPVIDGTGVTRQVNHWQDGDGHLTQFFGNAPDLRGAFAARPAANTVPVGTTWWAIDRIGQPTEVTVSTGSQWVNT